MERYKLRWLDCAGMDLEEAVQIGEALASIQHSVNFWIGDLQRFAEAKWPERYHQIWPPTMSPGLAARCAGVCKSYPAEADRQANATYTQYMQVANKPDRQARLIEAEGQTSDETRQELAKERAEGNKPRWMLAIDVNYFLHRFWFSGAGVESAMSVSKWIGRTIERLREKGLTDAVACFDSPVNARKDLTKDWEDKYKDRPAKDPELSNQIRLVRSLIEKSGIACVSIDGWEADDVMASYAKQFAGKVTLMTQDKDARQCLSDRVNMLRDVEWSEDPTTGESIPAYKWLTYLAHTEETGIRPDQWPDYQAIMGDNCDGIKGAIGIGEKGAKSLIQEFGTADAAIQAALAGDDRIKPKQRSALIAFETRIDITRQLVTLNDELQVPMTTRL